ncbi:MAG: hypothetical protein ABW202_22375, partial [Duganella sp.]
NVGLNTNGAGATVDGAEFNATVRPLRGLRLSANGAYNRSRLDGDTSPLVGGRKGDRLPFSPRYTLSLMGDYRWTVGDTTPVYVGASIRQLARQSGAFDNAFRTAYGRHREVASYNVLDAHVGAELGRWTVELYGKNLGNREGKTSTSTVTANGANMYPNGAINTGVITPRTIGLTLTTEY